MTQNPIDVQKIKNYYLVCEGLNITEVIEHGRYLILEPHGYVPKDNPYGTLQEIEEEIEMDMDADNLEDLADLPGLTHVIVGDWRYLWGLEDGWYIYEEEGWEYVSQITHLSIHNIDSTLNLSFISKLPNLEEISFLWLRSIGDVTPLLNHPNLKIIDISDDDGEKVLYKIPSQEEELNTHRHRLNEIAHKEWRLEQDKAYEEWKLNPQSCPYTKIMELEHLMRTDPSLNP